MKPEDTSTRDPLLNIVAMMGGASEYITEMEAAGQRQLVLSDVLPVDCRGQESEIEALGIQFGEQVDDLFRRCTLPDGWRIEASDHDMWSYVLDTDDERRVAVFYKAAFYDRRAFMRLESSNC